MKKIKLTKNKKIVVTAVLFSCILLNGCQKKDKLLSASVKNDELVYKIQEQECTVAEAKTLLVNYQNIYQELNGVDIWNQESQKTSLNDYVKALTISQMAEITTLCLMAEEQGIQLQEAEVKNMENAAEAYYNSLNEDEIKYMGVKKENIEKMYQQYGLANKFYAFLMEESQVEISEEEARVTRIQQIYTTDKKNVKKIQKKLKKGEDFVSLSRAYNEADKMDIAFSRGEIPTEIEEIAFTLEDNQISDKISVGEGYYFIKCIDNYDETLSEEKRENLESVAQQAAFDQVYQTYMESLSSEYNEKLWGKIKLEEKENINTKSFFSTYESYCE